MRRSCHEKSRQGTDLSPRTVRESARRGVAGGAFSVIVQTLGTCLGRFGPPRPPWWPETASPRKQRPNSGVEAEIRPLGAHFLATSRLRQKPVYPPPPRHEKTLLAPTGRRGGELAPRGGGWRPCRGFRGGARWGPARTPQRAPEHQISREDGGDTSNKTRKQRPEARGFEHPSALGRHSEPPRQLRPPQGEAS